MRNLIASFGIDLAWAVVLLGFSLVIPDADGSALGGLLWGGIAFNHFAWLLVWSADRFYRDV